MWKINSFLKSFNCKSNGKICNSSSPAYRNCKESLIALCVLRGRAYSMRSCLGGRGGEGVEEGGSRKGERQRVRGRDGRHMEGGVT